MKLKFGLRVRFIIIFLLFSVVISVAAGYVTRDNYQKTIEKQYLEKAIETANLAASFVDGDKVEEYIRTLEKDETYEETQDDLNHIRRNNDVGYLYVLQVASDTETIYVFDTWTVDTPVENIGSWVKKKLIIQITLELPMHSRQKRQAASLRLPRLRSLDIMLLCMPLCLTAAEMQLLSLV